MACPPLAVALLMDGGHGAKGAFPHPTHADLQCGAQSGIEFRRALFHEAS
jgi:hypothetical protein